MLDSKPSKENNGHSAVISACVWMFPSSSTGDERLIVREDVCLLSGPDRQNWETTLRPWTVNFTARETQKSWAVGLHFWTQDPPHVTALTLVLVQLFVWPLNYENRMQTLRCIMVATTAWKYVTPKWMWPRRGQSQNSQFVKHNRRTGTEVSY